MGPVQLPSMSEILCGAVDSALWQDLAPSTRDWEETAAKLQHLGFRSYLLVISWRFLEGNSDFSEGLKSYVAAVESLLQHGLEPILVLDFTNHQTSQDFRPSDWHDLMDAFIPHVRFWFTLLEHSRMLPGKPSEEKVKRRWQTDGDPSDRARLGHAAAKEILEQHGVQLGLLLAVDWLEPGEDEHLVKQLTERIMKRQLASFFPGTGGYGKTDDLKSKESSIMILPRYAAHIHVQSTRDVKISDMSRLDFKTHRKMVNWFRQEAGFGDAEMHIIASVHTPISQIVQGIQQIHHMNERFGIEGKAQDFSGFWIDEENALRIDSRPKLPLYSSPFEVMEEIRKLGSSKSTWSFLVALTAVEQLEHLDIRTISRFRAAMKRSSCSDGPVPPSSISPIRQGKWDRTLNAAVNARRKKSKDLTMTLMTLGELQMEMEGVNDLAAHILLAWRRQMRQPQLSDETWSVASSASTSSSASRLHLPSIFATLEAALELGSLQASLEQAANAIRASKESSTRSLPPLQPLAVQATPAEGQSTDVEAAGLAALFISWCLHGSANASDKSRFLFPRPS